MTKNKAARASVAKKGCIVCGAARCDACHILTYAHTRKDDEDNMLPMCRTHHSEQHALGWWKFCQKYLSVKITLRMRGYFFDTNNHLVKGE